MRIEGLKVHNLKNISLDIPLGKLVALVGISGSGKTNLAFHTLFAEGQRKLLESVSHKHRVGIEQLPRPRADELIRIPPAFAIRQSHDETPSSGSIASVVEVCSLLAEFFRKQGEKHCSQCHERITKSSPKIILNHLLEMSPGTKVQLAFSINVDPQKLNQLQKELLAAGYTRQFPIPIQQTPHLSEPAIPPSKHSSRKSYSKNTPQTELLVIVDRIITHKTEESRLLESIKLAIKEGEGTLLLLTPADATRNDSPDNVKSPGIISRTQKIWRDEQERDWNIETFHTNNYCYSCQTDLRTSTTDELIEIAISSTESQQMKHKNTVVPSSSLLPSIEFSYHQLSWNTLLTSPIKSWHQSFITHCSKIEGDTQLTRKIEKHLNQLIELNLGYLSFSRFLSSLSQGEYQKLCLYQLAMKGIMHALFIIDEPSVGSHPGELDAINKVLGKMREAGNSIVLVEHNPALIAKADLIYELGPGSGSDGGTITFSGTWEAYQQSVDHNNSRRGSSDMSLTKSPTSKQNTKMELKITGINTRFLKNLKLNLPLNQLVMICGISGAGKSTLLEESIYPAILTSLTEVHHERKIPALDICKFKSISGTNSIDDCVLLSNRNYAEKPGQILANRLEVFTEIRKLFAQTEEARRRNFKPIAFTFLVPKGRRCTKCKGTGEVQLKFPDLSPLIAECQACSGTRYKPEILEILYQGLTIPEVLSLTIAEAFQFFRHHPRIQKPLHSIIDVGLGYITLGRKTGTLSGGERQRLFLAETISKGQGKHILFLFDDPMSGLHPTNKQEMLETLTRLLELGHSIITIEHDPNVIHCADYVIELGPYAGEEGGEIIAQGPPDVLADNPHSQMGRYLKLSD